MDCKKHSAFIWSFIKFNHAPMYSIMRLAPAQTRAVSYHRIRSSHPRLSRPSFVSPPPPIGLSFHLSLTRRLSSTGSHSDLDCYSGGCHHSVTMTVTTVTGRPGNKCSSPGVFLANAAGLGGRHCDPDSIP